MNIGDGHIKKNTPQDTAEKMLIEAANALLQSEEYKNINKKVKELENLFGTEAGQMALEMDVRDGTRDGFISASIWNAYVEGQEGRTPITNKISVQDAMNSITTYMVREEAQENGPDAEPEENDPTIDYD